MLNGMVNNLLLFYLSLPLFSSGLPFGCRDRMELVGNLIRFVCVCLWWDFDKQISNFAQEQPLHIAVDHKYISIIRILVDHGKHIVLVTAVRFLRSFSVCFIRLASAKNSQF